ncbi:hypothetical protein VNO77_02503 [Canavalia gladiata]|uniref:Uncharacterized protein n=1 Tax=Canavalia gladiata TaxID=3824 RepID=A0AAN9MYH7_CANGL
MHGRRRRVAVLQGWRSYLRVPIRGDYGFPAFPLFPHPWWPKNRTSAPAGPRDMLGYPYCSILAGERAVSGSPFPGTRAVQPRAPVAASRMQMRARASSRVPFHELSLTVNDATYLPHRHDQSEYAVPGSTRPPLLRRSGSSSAVTFG